MPGSKRPGDMNIYLETFGCQMNRLDSELITARLRTAGHAMVDDPAAAEAVLYNTCSVREHAEEKVFSRLGVDAQRRSAGKRLIVAVIGCMAQRYGAKIRKRSGIVDVVCGPGQIHRLPELLAEAAEQPADALDPPRSAGGDPAAESGMDRLDATRDPSATASPTQAFVRIARGCDNFCSYCIVPYVRGAERSRRPDAIAEEVRRLVGAGRSEITLLGQTVNRYRHQAGETTVRFSDLLERLSPIPGLRRLRFVTSHPKDFGNDVLDAMAALPNVCEYIHCPAQSGSDAMLAAMNRHYTRAEYDDLLARARQRVGGVVFAGDFIVGFPGESQADHQASAELIRQAGYKNSFVFKYSPRPGTAAAKRLADDVPEAVKKRRNNELLAVQQEVGAAHHAGYVGRRLEVLVEGPSPRADKQPTLAPPGGTQLIGRTRWDHIFVFDGPEGLANGYVEVDITASNALTLFGALPEAVS